MTDAELPFDVFLCHNGEDKKAVIEIANQLKDYYKIRPWLDVWELRPGFPWQPELENQITHINSAAVFVGKSGIGPWQSRELYAFLSEFHKRECPVIPVLLPDAPQQPQLPIFLRGMTWVDFRQQTHVYTDPMVKLVWGITGQKPVPTVKVIPQSQSDDLSSESKKEVLTTQELRNPEVIETQNTPQNQRDDSGDDLSSKTGVKYTRLRDLLKAGQWKEADEETFAVMLKATGREKEGWLCDESIKNFPCTDLRTIDQLWVKYSSGRFGFSVQKRIWESVGKDIAKYGDRVGWRKGKFWSWLAYNQLTFSTKAPQGHLPQLGVTGNLNLVDRVSFLLAFGDCYDVLFSRVQTCKL